MKVQYYHHSNPDAMVFCTHDSRWDGIAICEIIVDNISDLDKKLNLLGWCRRTKWQKIQGCYEAELRKDAKKEIAHRTRFVNIVNERGSLNCRVHRPGKIHRELLSSELNNIAKESLKNENIICA